MEEGLISLLGFGGYLIYKLAKGDGDFLYCKAEKFYEEGKYKKSLEAINLSIDLETHYAMHYLLKGKIEPHST